MGTNELLNELWKNSFTCVRFKDIPKDELQEFISKEFPVSYMVNFPDLDRIINEHSPKA